MRGYRDEEICVLAGFFFVDGVGVGGVKGVYIGFWVLSRLFFIYCLLIL